MSTLVIDTHRVTKILRDKGFTEEQAEGVLQAIGEVDLSTIASKTDIAGLKTDMANLKAEIFRFIVITAGVQIAILGLMMTLLKLV